MLVSGMKPAAIARQMGISVPTLRKHYFSNGKINHRLAREMAVAEARAKNMLQLQAQADKGNVSAMKALTPLIEKAERDMIEDELRRSPREESPGRKREREMEGFAADDELEDLLSREARERVH